VGQVGFDQKSQNGNRLERRVSGGEALLVENQSDRPANGKYYGIDLPPARFTASPWVSCLRWMGRKVEMKNPSQENPLRKWIAIFY
jgi:hypothetical protein